MDIFKIQSLINDRRVVTANDIDPTESYLQVGVFQQGNSRISSGNADAYPSYAIPISEISGKSLKNVIVVDSKYGDDASAIAAGVYDFNKPFKTIDAAIQNAADSNDTLWVLGDYQQITEQILNRNFTIYAWNCVLDFSVAQIAQTGYAGLTIKGNANIALNDIIDTTLSDYSFITIECTNFYTNSFGGYFFLDNAVDVPCYFALKADYIQINSVVLSFAGLNWNVNIDCNALDATAQSNGVGLIWSAGLTVNPTAYKTACNYNLGNVTFNALNGTSLIKMVSGTPDQKFFITGNYNATNIQGTVTAPTAIVEQDASESYVDINATMNLVGVGVYATRSAVSQAIIRGNIQHDYIGQGSPYAACYYISVGKVKLYADTIGIDKQMIYITNGAYLDITNCKLVNTGTVNNIIMYIDTSRVKIQNAKFIVDLTNTYSATASAAILVQIYSLFDNVALDGATIANAFAGTTSGEMTDALMTDIGF